MNKTSNKSDVKENTVKKLNKNEALKALDAKIKVVQQKIIDSNIKAINTDEFAKWKEIEKEILEGKTEWVSWKGRDKHILRVIDWTMKTFFYTDKNWDDKDYIITDKGKLAMGSRLKAALLPFALKNFKGQLLIERTGTGLQTEYFCEEY